MRKLLWISTFVIIQSILFRGTAAAQEEENNREIFHFTATITDPDGNPVSNATVYGDGGSVVVASDDEGSFSIDVPRGTTLLIKSEGYLSRKVEANPDALQDQIVLEPRPYQAGDDDVVHIPFGTIKKRYLTGSVTVLNPGDFSWYDANQDIYSALQGRVPGLYDSINIYGMGAALLVVDGIPRPVTSLNLQEIEQITVLKDPVSRLLYGAKADLPVILFTTRRGESFKNRMDVRFESGLNNPVSYPEYLGAADYMTLYNEALANDGRAPRYDSLAIAATRNGDNFVLYPDEQYYNSNYLRRFKNYQNLIAEASGGNDIAGYYAYMGWKTQNSLLALGDEERYNRINLRGNSDYRINDFIRMRADGVAIFEFSNNLKNGDFWQNASTFLPNQAPVLIPVSDDDLLASASLINNRYVLGGTSIYQENIYGDMVLAGYRKSMNRILQINAGLDVGLDFITPGLTGKAYLTFDLRNFYESRLQNSYAVYEPVIVTGSEGQDSIGLNKIGLDIKQGSESLVNPDIYRRVGLFGTLNYDRVFNEDHELHAIGVAYRQQLRLNQQIFPGKDLHFGIQANYIFRKKYIVQAGVVVPASPKLPENTRYAISPAVGAAWILSDEGFMAGDIFDYLKLRFNWGLINTDVGIDQQYLYQTTYSQGSNFNYNQGVIQNRVRNFATLANPNLDWVKRMETSAGFEALVLNRTLQIEGTYFHSLLFNEITTRDNFYPDLLGSTLPYENYESHLDQGAEVGLTFHRGTGNLNISAGSNLVYAVPRVIRIDEPDYEYEYLTRTGKPTDAIFGWVDEGLFINQEDIENHAVQTFGPTQPGDIKYRDLNNDGIIDDNDMKVIGYERARLQYAAHLNIRYRLFELFVIGTGQTGRSTFYNNPYYWVYGERKYSEPVLGRWTPATAGTATYPRLSSTNNSNNFRNSTYWLEKEDWFTVQRVQLTMNIPERIANNSFVAGLQVYLRGYNLVTISKNRVKRELNIGTEPQLRTFAAGINVSF
jgi:TonB-linked SusC/RagA family outer membrane protein